MWAISTVSLSLVRFSCGIEVSQGQGKRSLIRWIQIWFGLVTVMAKSSLRVYRRTEHRVCQV